MLNIYNQEVARKKQKLSLSVHAAAPACFCSQPAALAVTNPKHDLPRTEKAVRQWSPHRFVAHFLIKHSVPLNSHEPSMPEGRSVWEPPPKTNMT